MDGLSVDYLERRERCERAAAKRAASIHARRAHQELARYYCALIMAAERARGSPNKRTTDNFAWWSGAAEASLDQVSRQEG